MVEYIKGNLLSFPGGINVIAHSANCQNTMGSGIALQIKEEYPAAYEADTKAKESNENELGLFSVATLVSGKRIINCYTQEFYGTDKRHVDYEAFYVCFQRIRDLLEGANKEGRHYVLGVPKFISSDRAGGSWRIIETMLLDLFENSPVKLVIVEYNKIVLKSIGEGKELLGGASEMAIMDVQNHTASKDKSEK